VLQAARELGVDIDSICGGQARCSRCQVKPIEGIFAKEGITSSANHLSDMSVDDQICQQEGLLKTGNRLSCQAKIFGDVKIAVPAGSQVHDQVVRKDIEVHGIEPDPPIRPGFRDRMYGVAVDVGSTTIAAHLCDLSNGEVLASTGAMNPQIRYGEDLMSRVSYAMLHTGGAKQMTDAVRAAINELIASAAKQAHVDLNEIFEITLVGNPVMHHLLLGLDPTPLGSAPFPLTVEDATEIPATELDLHLAAGARAYILPCIAGHVGADTAAVLLAETPWKSDKISLIIDVGTNAEIILGNRNRLLAASSPTGPAFEGAQISSGQRAAPGAIERVRIDPQTLEPRFKVIGGTLWSNEPGFDDDLGGEEPGEQHVTGICGSGIIEAIASMYLAGIIRPDGVIDGKMVDRNPRIEASGRTFSYLLHQGDPENGKPEIRIQQADVRAIQLAKAALYAGARLLMDRMGVDKVDRIRLAGAFGSHIDVKYAMVLGMIPDCDLAQVSSVGNAASTGARIALLNKASRKEIENRVCQVEKVETATDENFQKHFVDAMAIPHASHIFTNLSQAIRLPDTPEAGTSLKGKRRRRSRTR
jgi:uncharacterized 2Fe-2S/4Fe-4S cluster protein (DUF4445 family)